MKQKVREAGGYVKSFYKAYELKNTKDIEYLRNWVWTMKEIVQKQKTIKGVSDIRKYFTSDSNKNQKKIRK